jgi:hypothetical protein
MDQLNDYSFDKSLSIFRTVSVLNYGVRCQSESVMSDQGLEIVFRGDIVVGHTLPEVKQRFGQLFKISAAQVDKLFTGKPVVLKRDLDRSTAEKYQAAISKAGAQVQIIDPGAKATRTVRLSLAPAGSPVLPPSHRAKVEPAVVDTSHLSLRAQQGNLVDANELEQPEPLNLDIANWEVAQAGAVLDQVEKPAMPEPPVAQWDIALPGAQLGEQVPELPQVELSVNFDLAPVGELLVEASEAPPVAVPDTSHLALD